MATTMAVFHPVHPLSAVAARHVWPQASASDWRRLLAGVQKVIVNKASPRSVILGK
jgi:hypothetical protein